jgi:hypothetical protein
VAILSTISHGEINFIECIGNQSDTPVNFMNAPPILLYWRETAKSSPPALPLARVA